MQSVWMRGKCQFISFLNHNKFNVSAGICCQSNKVSGERGIRTPGPQKGSTVFETAPFDRSGISPGKKGRRTHSSAFRFCGERGIRTPGPREGSTVFKTAAFDHSAISPFAKIEKFFVRENFEGNSLNVIPK